jgi:hypothetical protein
MKMYLVVMLIFALVGAAVLIIKMIASRPCWKCLFWKMINGDPSIGICKLKQLYRVYAYERLVLKGLLMNAKKFWQLQTSTTKELDSCSEFEVNDGKKR